MSFRIRSTVVIFGLAALGMSALIIDRQRFTRHLLLDMIQERTGSVAEVAASQAAPFVAAEDDAGLRRAVEPFASIEGIAYLEALDGQARTRYHWQARPELGEIPRTTAHVASVPIPWEGKSIGELRLGRSRGLVSEALSNDLDRALLLAVPLLALLAGVAWLLGGMLAGRLERLVEAVEQIRSDSPPALPDDDRQTEVGCLSRAFKRLYEELHREWAKRRELEEMRLDMASMTVHDLKHPLTLLRLAVDPMGDAKMQRDRLRFSRGIAIKALARLEQMVDDLVEAARLSAPEMPLRRRRLALRSFLEECSEEAELVVSESKREWRTGFAEGLGEAWVYADASILRRVLANLILNAVQHTSTGTAITLGARPAADLAGHVEIFVRDEGPGIPPGLRRDLFEKYSSTGGEGHLGLGLAFCRLAVEKHRGRLRVSSLEGQGTVFSVVLPAGEPQSAPDPVPA